jgi:flagellar protein FlgJ
MKPPIAAGDLAAPLAIDANALAGLREQAKTSPKAALSAAATQFEALFMQQLLKSMREALPQDGLLSSETSKTYTAMFDQQIAQQMSKKGIGLAKILERQLAPALGGGEAAAAGAAGKTDAAATTKSVPATAAAVGAAAPSSSSAAAPATAPGAADGAQWRIPANVKAFIETMRPHAEAAAKAVGVPADLLLAQAGLETGWGKSQPRTADGTQSHNLFGIKAGRAWNGAVAVAHTTEYVAGALTRTVDRFRSYGSYTEAFKDFAHMLSGSGRYAKAVASSDDPVAYARSLQSSGYATDPHYADKLVRAIRLVSGQGSNGQGRPAQVMAAGAVKPSDEAAG